MCVHTSAGLLLLLFYPLWCRGYVLNCESDTTSSPAFKSRRYFPNLITLSRLQRGQYTVSLRCQGMTLDGRRLQQDYISIRRTINFTKSEVARDERFAKYMSMGCGNACFNPVVTERNLLIGKVCKDVTVRRAQRCRQTEIRVVSGDGEEEEVQHAGISAGWIAAIVLALGGAGVFFYCLYKKRGRKKDDEAETSSDQDEPTGRAGYSKETPRIVVSNHSESGSARKTNVETTEGVDDIKYANEYS